MVGPYNEWNMFAPAFVKHAQTCDKRHPVELEALIKKLGIKLKAKISKVPDKEFTKGETFVKGMGLREGGFANTGGGGGGRKEGAKKSEKQKVKEKNEGTKRRGKDAEQMVQEVRGVGATDSEVEGSAEKRMKRAGSIGARGGGSSKNRVSTPRFGYDGKTASCHT